MDIDLEKLESILSSRRWCLDKIKALEYSITNNLASLKELKLEKKQFVKKVLDLENQIENVVSGETK